MGNVLIVTYQKRNEIFRVSESGDNPRDVVSSQS